MSLTLLTKEQIIGRQSLSFFHEFGIKAAITDYAIALGGYVSDADYINEDQNSLANRTGYYWTETRLKQDKRKVVYYNGSLNYLSGVIRDVGIRVVLPYSIVAQNATDMVKINNNVMELEAGYYPNKVATKTKKEELEELKKELKEAMIVKKYTIDSRNYNDYKKEFRPQELMEIELEGGSRYTETVIKPRFGKKEIQLSDGNSYQVGETAWFERCPIRWYGDSRKKVAITKDIIMAGIPFGYFDMHYYLNTYLMKEMEINTENVVPVKKKRGKN